MVDENVSQRLVTSRSVIECRFCRFDVRFLVTGCGGGGVGVGGSSRKLWNFFALAADVDADETAVFVK